MECDPVDCSEDLRSSMNGGCPTPVSAGRLSKHSPDPSKRAGNDSASMNCRETWRWRSRHSLSYCNKAAYVRERRRQWRTCLFWNKRLRRRDRDPFICLPFPTLPPSTCGGAPDRRRDPPSPFVCPGACPSPKPPPATATAAAAHFPPHHSQYSNCQHHGRHHYRRHNDPALWRRCGRVFQRWSLLSIAILSVFLYLPHEGSCGNPDAKRLYDDLLSNYNKLVRPVVNVSTALTVRIKLKLSQLIDVNLKNQIMTTNLWVEQYWYDYKLTWEPEEYGGVDMLHVPSDHIWRPDIVLYNNADGNFEVTLATKATLHNNGLVEWKPPAIYKSSCEIDVEYFPFDEQTCVMKFGSWTYDGFQVDLRHIDERGKNNVVDVGVDLSEFYMSVEWDILAVPAVRNEKFYTCCDEPYLDITFNITMRRKTLFYTVNLIIPCMGISFLTVLVFYLPSDSGEKVNLSISILVSLTVFFLLVTEIIPPTSVSLPLLGKYLIFAMVLVTLSICVTVVVLNVHFRSPQTHTMAPWVRRVFLQILPRLLVMKRPHYHMDKHRVMVRTFNGVELRDYHQHDRSRYYGSGTRDFSFSCPNELRDLGGIPRPPRPRSDYFRDLDMGLNGACKVHGHPIPPPPPPPDDSLLMNARSGLVGDRSPPCRNPSHAHYCPEVHRAFEGVKFIAEHTRKEEESIRVKEDWKYVAMVLDRLFLWIFTMAVLVGTAGIILQAPTLYDDRKPIDLQLSEIAAGTHKPMRNPNNPTAVPPQV